MTETTNYIPEIDYAARGYRALDPKDRPTDMCGNCRAYYKMLYDKGLTKKPFPPKCSGHVLDGLAGLDVTDFESEEAMLQARVNMDPVTWAVQNLHWEPRWYQEFPLSCTSVKKSYRFGRRCLTADNLVAMADGSHKPINQIEIGEQVLSQHKFNRRLTSSTVSEVHDNGVQSVYRINLADGSSVTCTANHPFLASVCADHGRGRKLVWQTIETGLAVGSSIRVARQTCFGPDHRPDEAKLLGYLLTDGCFTGNTTPKFTNTNLRYHAEVRTLTEKMFSLACNLRERDRSGVPEHHTDRNHSTGNPASEWLESLGLAGTKAKSKFVPDFLFTCDAETIALFLNRAWSGDGCVYVGKPRLGRRTILEASLTSCSEELLHGVKLLLRKFGVCAHIKKERTRNNHKLTVTGSHDLVKFFEHVGLIYGKEKKSKEAFDLAKSQLELGRTRRVAGSIDFRTETIRSIEPAGSEPTYCITVERDSTFLVDGVLTHNSGKTDMMVVETLFASITNAYHTTLWIAPYMSQVEEAWDKMKALIQRSEVQNSIKRSKAGSPMRMEFYNGSKILGLSASAQSGSSSDKIRGLDAHLIIIDEFDTMADRDVDAIMALMASHANCRVIISSTPRGWRKKFYNYNTDKNLGFKEYWFPAMEKPDWTQELEDFLRKSASSEANFIHEYAADFAESEEGVFKRKHIDRALARYEMDAIAPLPGALYVCGVDWNKSAGTHILILQWTGEKFLPVRKIIVPESEYMQTASVEYLIQLDRQWNFKMISVDAGYGSVQVEMLKKYGVDNPQSGMYDKVCAIHMNQSVDVRDPLTGIVERKPAKPFLVHSTVKVLEDNYLILPQSEDTNEQSGSPKMGFVQQMRNFIVESYSIYGQPKYSQEDDHTVTALMLAVGGYILKFGDLNRVEVARTIGVNHSDNVDAEPTKRTGAVLGSPFNRSMEREDHLGRRQVLITGIDQDPESPSFRPAPPSNPFRRKDF